MSEWISVKDKLPKPSTEVLIFIYDILALGYMESDGEWWNDADEKEHSESVTHWMPLPEPPEEL